MSVPPAMLPISIDLTTTYGGLLGGNVLAIGFWFLQIFQTGYYYLNYMDDSWAVKISVAVLFALSTAHQIVTMKPVWVVLIQNYGKFAQLTDIQPELVYQLLLTGIAAALVQGFLLSRIFLFSRNKVLSFGAAAVLVPLIIAQLVGEIYYTARGLSYNTILRLPELQGWAVQINACALAADILIAVVMCYLLNGSRTGIRSTNQLIRNLMIVSLNSGTWTALCATMILILEMVRPNELWYSLFNLPMCALYCNSLLGNLNSRRLAKGTNHIHDVSGSTTAGGRSAVPHHKIMVTTDVESSGDVGNMQMRTFDGDVSKTYL